MEAATCSIDSTVLNADTLSEMRDIGLSFFASACGKNRGAFVLDPPDGQTYGCLNMPKDLPKLAGATNVSEGIQIENANAIKDQYKAGNITASDTLAILNFLVESVYKSTPNKGTSPYACEISGLAKLSCSSQAKGPRTDGMPIRAANLAGLFVPALWATNGKELTLEEGSAWYSPEDFKAMKTIGLNTVQVSVPTAAFTMGDEYGGLVKEALSILLEEIDQSGLQVIMNLVSTADEKDAVVAAAKFAEEYKSNVILGITYPSGMLVDSVSLIEAMRVVAPNLPIFVPMNEGDLVKINGEFDSNVYGALEFSHSVSIADIASSTSLEDRSKMFYHEATACIARSPLEFASCFQNMPIFLSSGFDLSIDDCINQGASNFMDYGQCDRFEETLDSQWWHRHRQSFAARQIYAYEQGLGWSFATWKLYENEAVGVLDSPAKLLSLEDVIAAGLFPNLTSDTVANDACLNPPEPDFAMGDATFAPTMGPPPDCGNGWWNYETEQCDYWIPPPPTESPTGCPICSDCTFSTEESKNVVGTPLALLIGVVIGGVITALAFKVAGFKKTEYTTIP